MSADGRDGSPPSTLVLGPAEDMLRKAVRNTVAAICERFGKGTTMTLDGDLGDQPGHDRIPAGTLNLDDALGLGSLPLGSIVEIYAPESLDTTTLTLRLIAAAQQRGLVCAFIDADHGLDVQVARSLGVDTSELLVSQPDNGEQALEIADSLAQTGTVGLIVVDSVAALIPKAELAGDMDDCHIGLQARLISQAMRKLSGGAAQTNTLVLIINDSPGITIVTSAIRYYVSVRLDTRRIATLVAELASDGPGKKWST